MLIITVLDDLSTFEYLEIMMMLKYVYDMWSLNGVTLGCGWGFL
jgi:hypothetical protein